MNRAPADTSLFSWVLRKAGWDVYRDGEYSDLGTAFYQYVKSETPEQQLGCGRMFHNDVEDDEENEDDESEI